MVTMMPVMTLVMNGVSLLIVWVGGHQIAQSTMQVGDMMAFIQYAMQVIMSFLFISMMFVMVPRASVSAERVHEVLATRPSVRDKEQPRHLPQPVRGVVESATSHSATAGQTNLCCTMSASLQSPGRQRPLSAPQAQANPHL